MVWVFMVANFVTGKLGLGEVVGHQLPLPPPQPDQDTLAIRKGESPYASSRAPPEPEAEEARGVDRTGAEGEDGEGEGGRAGGAEPEMTRAPSSGSQASELSNTAASSFAPSLNLLFRPSFL